MNALSLTDSQIRGAPPLASPAGSLQPVRWNGEAAVHAGGVPSPGAEVTPKEVEQAAEGVNAFLKSSGSHVQFAFHEESKRMMVEVVDDRTQEVLKTIPPKSLLDLAAKIGEMVGLFMDKRG